MESPPVPTKSSDGENLNLLAIFHYVVGGIGFLLACFPMIHLFIGIVMIVGPGHALRNGGAGPAIIGYIFAGIATVLILLGWSMALCTLMSGRMIAKRKNRMFSFVVAAVLCIFFPFGTILGVFTIVLLNKETVKALYAQRR